MHNPVYSNTDHHLQLSPTVMVKEKYRNRHCINDTSVMPIKCDGKPTFDNSNKEEGNASDKEAKDDADRDFPLLLSSPSRNSEHRSTTQTASEMNTVLPKGIPLCRPPVLVSLSYLSSRVGTKRLLCEDGPDYTESAADGSLLCHSQVYYPRGTIVTGGSADNSENVCLAGGMRAPQRTKRLKVIGFRALAHDRPLDPPPFALPHRPTL